MAEILSIVIPIYNHFEYLDQCFTSILEQYNHNIELICINDNSSDKRVSQYLLSLRTRPEKIKIIENPQNFGISKVLNQGVQISKGSYLAFVDCDDYLHPKAIYEVLNHIEKFPNIDYFFSDRYDVNEENKIIRTAIYGGYPNIKPSGNIKNDLLQGMVASHLKVIKRSSILEAGCFEVTLDGVQDWDLALKIAEKGNFFYIQKPLYFHRIHSDSVTSSEKSSQFRKTNIVRRKFYERWFNKQSINLNRSVIIENFSHINSGNENLKCDSFDIFIYSPEKLSLLEIISKNKNGAKCVFDARYEFKLDWINFLRENNSFFDLILFSDPRVAVAIIGYLWDINILVQINNNN